MQWLNSSYISILLAYCSCYIFPESMAATLSKILGDFLSPDINFLNFKITKKIL